MKKVSIVATILVIYVMPTLLILTKIIDFQYRFYLLIICTLILLLQAYLSGVKFHELGFHLSGINAAMKNIYPMSLGLAAIAIFIYILKGTRIDNTNLNWYFYLFFIFGSVPAQEFSYRSYLFYLCQELGLSSRMQISISTLLYGFMHIIYGDLPTLVLTLIVGLLWGYHYGQFKNIYSVIASHASLGVLAIASGMI